MNKAQHKLLIDQMDRRLKDLKVMAEIPQPSKGWVHSIRTALRMSLRQLGMRLNISAQSVKEIEQREIDGSLTLKSLQEVADALEMKLVYAVIPKNESIEMMIEKRAQELAHELVLRTSTSMRLEDQENSAERVEKAIREKTTELINSMPRYLWD